MLDDVYSSGITLSSVHSHADFHLPSNSRPVRCSLYVIRSEIELSLCMWRLRSPFYNFFPPRKLTTHTCLRLCASENIDQLRSTTCNNVSLQVPYETSSSCGYIVSSPSPSSAYAKGSLGSRLLFCGNILSQCHKVALEACK